MANEIKCEKIFLGKIFDDMWFSIPSYQRPYVWGKDQVSELLDDIVTAMRTSEENEYFIGSFVIRPVKSGDEEKTKYIQNELLDGQQRLTTFLLIFSTLRDRVTDSDAKATCEEAIFRAGNKSKGIPERERIKYDIRGESQDFIEALKDADSTNTLAQELDGQTPDISVRNMANALFQIGVFLDKHKVDVDRLVGYLWQNISLIYVSTEELSDAIRLFNVLNNRGIPLRSSDILKSINLDAVPNTVDKTKYARMWESAENLLEDDFDRFLGFIRTILLKDKARTGLLQEFENKIYGAKNSPIIEKGSETFDLIGRYKEHYETLFSNANYKETFGHSLDNLIFVMEQGFQSEDWVPPLLMYFDKFGFDDIIKFLSLLDNRFSSDWILGYTPTERIEVMNSLLKEIDRAETPQKLFKYENLYADEDEWQEIEEAISGDIYRKRFNRYLLLKLNFMTCDKTSKMYFSKMSIEHILPQNPKAGSQWLADFDEEKRGELTHILGNLVIISRSKNSSFGNLDFAEKMKLYFNNIDSIPHTVKTLADKKKWKPKSIKKNQKALIEHLKSHYLTLDK